MHQAVNTSSQADEHAEVGDGFDRALDAVATFGVDGKLLPRVGLALLHTQGDATFVFVDFQNHDFDFIAECDKLVRRYVFVGPVHLGHVNQAFNTWLEFNKCAVIGDVGDLAKQASALWVAAVHAHPWVVAHLFQTQGHAIFLGVKLENLSHNFLASRHYFAWVTHAAPRHIGDMQQAINSAQVNKCTVFGDVLDHALDR